MNLLGLDTSSIACAVGVQAGERLITRHEEHAREHTKLLLPMIRDALQVAELDVSDIEAIVLGNGPGSFVGVRIAASVAQGLAYGLGIGVVPVSSMAAVAAAAGIPGATVAVAQDAHMQQVYFGLYRIDKDGIPEIIVTERLQSQQAIPELDESMEVVAAGAGWERYPELTLKNKRQFRSMSEVRYPTAEAILKIGAAAAASGSAIPPERIDPAYLRDEVAQRQRPNSRNSSVI